MDEKIKRLRDQVREISYAIHEYHGTGHLEKFILNRFKQPSPLSKAVSLIVSFTTFVLLSAKNLFFWHVFISLVRVAHSSRKVAKSAKQIPCGLCASASLREIIWLRLCRVGISRG
jgi:hypothetical protein